METETEEDEEGVQGAGVKGGREEGVGVGSSGSGSARMSGRPLNSSRRMSDNSQNRDRDRDGDKGADRSGGRDREGSNGRYTGRARDGDGDRGRNGDRDRDREIESDEEGDRYQFQEMKNNSFDRILIDNDGMKNGSRNRDSIEHATEKEKYRDSEREVQWCSRENRRKREEEEKEEIPCEVYSHEKMLADRDKKIQNEIRLEQLETVRTCLCMYVCMNVCICVRVFIT